MGKFKKLILNDTCQSNLIPECIQWDISSPYFKESLVNFIRLSCKNKHPKCICEKSTLTILIEKYRINNTFVPDCKGDGSYSEVQCHFNTGYCWCVDTNGNPMSGTATIHQTPSCNIKVKMARNVRGNKRRRKRKCNSKDRADFIKAVVKYFINEFEKTHKNQSTPHAHMKRRKNNRYGKNKKNHIITWQFYQVDTDGDHQITRRELKILKKKLKRAMIPKNCLRIFDEDCDSNKDSEISIKEWNACLNLYQRISFRLFLSLSTEEEDFNENIDSNHNNDIINGPSLYHKQMNFDSLSKKTLMVPTILKTTNVKPDCLTERLKALKDEELNPRSGIFVPNCTNGKYASVQCHKGTGYCWCSNKDNGRPIPGTSRLDSNINCETREKLNVRQIKGCLNTLKQQFLVKLIDELSKEMVMEYTRDPKNFISWLKDDQSLEEKSVRWKYFKIDQNKNGVLDKAEWPLFRKTIGKIKIYRKCVRNFLRFCDINSDKRITISEWLDCTGCVKTS
ncbi:unnamed protein product [Gordionus sp. m RMFG-2023]